MKESQAIDSLGALANDVRLKIVRHLVTCGGAGASAGSIGDAVGAAPSKVSFHIATLERAGLVDAEKVSRQIIYRMNFPGMGALIEYLMADCCKYDSEVMSCCNVNRMKPAKSRK